MAHHTSVSSLFVCLMAATALAGAQAGTAAQGWLPLERQVRQQFPSVALDSHASFEPAQELVAGHMVFGMRARPLLTEAPGKAALSGALGVFYPATYDEAFVVESGNQRVALRAVGAQFSQSTTSAGKVFYTGPHDSVDAIEIFSTGRSEELLILHDARAPRVFEYEIAEMRGVAGLSMQNGEIRFAPDHVDIPTISQITSGRFTTLPPTIQIDRPWVIDADGLKSENAAQWTIVEERGHPQRIRLTVSADRLTYPLVLDPSFSTTGNLGAARSNHTATLLPNGKVLIAGGINLNTAELYDPATGMFTPTGSMSVQRDSHTATLLPNGKVLMAGGSLGSFTSSRDTAELYDPATGIFTAIGAMHAGRDSHTATLLQNGKVLIAGGVNGFVSGQTADLYDPSLGTNGTFTATLTMIAARSSHTATLLTNGNVLLAGGNVPFSGSLNSAELYNPADGANGTFTATANMNAARSAHSATLLANGKVLVAGGSSGSAAELFDPAGGTNGTFTFTTGGMSAVRAYHTATLLPNGKVLITGGKGASVLSSAELYDPSGGTFAATSTPMSAARYYHTATLLPDGNVLIAAGYDDAAYLNTAERYTSAAGSFTAITAAMSSARSYHTATLLSDGKVLIAGGDNTADLYDPSGGTPFTLIATMAMARYLDTATLLPDGNVLIAGGPYVPTAELYDAVKMTFIATSSPMTSKRQLHTATLLPDGRVLIAGGVVPGDSIYLNTAELYDPASGKFSATSGLMLSARLSHSATLLPDGKVLIAGGSNGSLVLPTAELFDPDTGMFTATGGMNTRHASHTATLLTNGMVLIAGGSVGVCCTGITELYDPASGTFTRAADMPPRKEHTATLLPNATVLIAGGQDAVSTALGTAEIYDPALGTFTATSAPMTSARTAHSATLLTNGKVLIAGGTSGAQYTAELYDAGLGFSDARRPVVYSLTNPVCQPANLALNGSLFTGDSEGSNGSTNSSASNAPLLRLQRIDNEQRRFALSSSFSASSVFSVTLSNLSSGRYRAAIVSNAIPSNEKILDVETVPSLGTYATTSVNLSGSAQVSPASLPAGYNGAFYPQTANGSNGFTGTLFINGSTGAVAVTNAGPVGDFNITVSSTNACGSLTTSFTLKVVGAPTLFTATAGTPQSALINTAFATPLQATVTDSAGHPLNNIGVNFTAPPSGASATLPGTGLVMTNASGVASVTATANGTTGRYNVKATVGGLPDALFDLSNISAGTPTNVVATAMTSTSVLITWNGVAGATYEVQRLEAANVSSTVGSSASGSLTDSMAIAGTSYLYAVREITPSVSTYGTADLATTVIFTDPSLASGINVKSAHFLEERTAVNAVRRLAGLGDVTYSDPLTIGVSMIKRVDLTVLRSALDEARTQLFLPAATYTRSSIVAGTTTISASDVNDLRTGVQ